MEVGEPASEVGESGPARSFTVDVDVGTPLWLGRREERCAGGLGAERGAWKVSVPSATLCGGDMVMIGRADDELDCFRPWLSLLRRLCSNDVDFCVRKLRRVAVGMPEDVGYSRR